jgi:hypothetical protein
MKPSNFERMIQLADDVFATKQDPDQLDVNEQVIERLLRIHPNSVSEYDDGNGPVAWLILIPSTDKLMQQFLKKELSEKELFLKTKIGESYDSVYLCSGLVLPEYRRKGITRKLAVNALAEIRKKHDVKSLVAWPFTDEGRLASENLAKSLALPLLIR